MKATFKRWVIGKVNQESGEIDEFVASTLDDYTPRLDCALLLKTEKEADGQVCVWGGEKHERALMATVTIEVDL